MSINYLSVDGGGLEQTFVQLIRDAKKQIIIGTPYFIPSKTLLAELRQAIGRGVQLTIIVPKISDHILVKEAAYRYFRILFKDGAHILQFHKGSIMLKQSLLTKKYATWAQPTLINAVYF